MPIYGMSTRVRVDNKQVIRVFSEKRETENSFLENQSVSAKRGLKKSPEERRAKSFIKRGRATAVAPRRMFTSVTVAHWPLPSMTVSKGSSDENQRTNVGTVRPSKGIHRS